MKIANIITEADAPINQAAKDLEKQYRAKLDQVPNVLKGIKKDLSTALAQLQVADAENYANAAPSMITDVVNRIVDFKNKDNNQPAFVGDANSQADVDEYIINAIKAKYQETIYGTVNRGEKGAGTAADTAAGAQPKPNEPTAAIPANIQSQLDGLTPQERDQLLKALAA